MLQNLVFIRLLKIYRLNEHLPYGRMGLSPVRPSLLSRPKSGRVQLSRPSIRLPARSRRKRRILTRQIGPQSRMATSRPSRRLLLAAMRANLTTSSTKRRVSWKRRHELETQITHLPNKKWMSEHFSATTIQIKITALYFVYFFFPFFFHSFSYLTFLWRWQTCLLLVVSHVQVPTTMIFFLSLSSAGCVCCCLFFLSNFSQHPLSSMLLVVLVSSVVLPVAIIPIRRKIIPVVVENAQMRVIVFALFPY